MCTRENDMSNQDGRTRFPGFPHSNRIRPASTKTSFVPVKQSTHTTTYPVRTLTANVLRAIRSCPCFESSTCLLTAWLFGDFPTLRTNFKIVITIARVSRTLIFLRHTLCNMYFRSKCLQYYVAPWCQETASPREMYGGYKRVGSWNRGDT